MLCVDCTSPAFINTSVTNKCYYHTIFEGHHAMSRRCSWQLFYCCLFEVCLGFCFCKKVFLVKLLTFSPGWKLFLGSDPFLDARFHENVPGEFLDQHFQTNRSLYPVFTHEDSVLAPPYPLNSLNNLGWKKMNDVFGEMSLPCASSIYHRCLCFQFECAFLRTVTSVTCVAAPKVHLCLCTASVEAVAAHTQHCSEKRNKEKKLSSQELQSSILTF